VIAAVCADPYGAAIWSWFTHGNLDHDDGDSFAEGIGQGRVTKNLEDFQTDAAYRIADQTALAIIHQLLGERLCLGLSSGINIAAAVRYAKEQGLGLTIVTILCDSGLKYESKLYNQEWLFDNEFDTELPLESVLG